RAVAMAERITRDWEHGQAGPPESFRTPGPDAPRLRLHAKQSEQAHLMIGLPGLSARDEDRYALSLLTTVLGDGMSSRLFVSLREEMGLAYDVHAYASNLHDTGSLSIYLGVDPENALPALRAALDQLAGLREGVPPAELHRVREYLKGRMLLNMEDTRAVSSWYGGQALLLDRTRSVEEIVERIALVIQFMAGFSIAVGLVILGGAIATGKYQRLREAVLLKTLGATRAAVAGVLSTEYALLGALAGIVGACGAAALSWGLVTFVFDGRWDLRWPPYLVAVALAVVLTTGIGLFANLDILNRKPLQVLREE
ncbi:MAG: insulinase family protein, partial [SAR324 cluster bacterium]|nr:insulinase family protein [SAR324 cluster bacterium]